MINKIELQDELDNFICENINVKTFLNYKKRAEEDKFISKQYKHNLTFKNMCEYIKYNIKVSFIYVKNFILLSNILYKDKKNISFLFFEYIFYSIMILCGVFLGCISLLLVHIINLIIKYILKLYIIIYNKIKKTNKNTDSLFKKIVKINSTISRTFINFIVKTIRNRNTKKQIKIINKIIETFRKDKIQINSQINEASGVLRKTYSFSDKKYKTEALALVKKVEKLIEIKNRIYFASIEKDVLKFAKEKMQIFVEEYDVGHNLNEKQLERFRIFKSI